MNNSNNNIKIVELKVCNQLYKVACNKPDLERLLYLANKFDAFISSLNKNHLKSSSNLNSSSNSLIFLIAGLTLIDKVESLTKELDELKSTSQMSPNKKNNEHELDNLVNYIDQRIKSLMKLISNNQS